jgi:hypothetical protein
MDGLRSRVNAWRTSLELLCGEDVRKREVVKLLLGIDFA